MLDFLHCYRAHRRLHSFPTRRSSDLLIPVYDEPVAVVEPTVAAAARMRGARVRVHLLDDGRSEEMRELATRHGAAYRSEEHTSELQSRRDLVCRLLLEKNITISTTPP